MAKKRVKIKRAIKKVNSRKKFPNPFNIFRGVDSAIKEISWNEKTLLVVLFVFMFFISLFSDSGIRHVTGSFTEVTGEQIVVDTGITQAINDVLGIVFGFAKPVLDLFGSKDLVTIKLLFALILYLILVYSPIDMRNKMHGKGKIIAGIIALFVAGVLPENIIKTYIVDLVPGFFSLIVAVGMIFIFLWALHKYEAESSAGHLLKALLYFLIFIYINTQRIEITETSSYLIGTPQVLGSIAFYALLAALIYSLFRVFIELYDAAAKRQKRIPEGAIEEGLSRAGRAAGKAYGGFKAGKESEKKKMLEDMTGAEELAENITKKTEGYDLDELRKEYLNEVKSKFPSVKEKNAKKIFDRALKNKGLK